MKLIRTNTYEELSQLTATIVTGYMVQDRRINLSLTSGNSPKRMYELLSEQVSRLGDLSNVFYYTFDEVPIKNSANDIVGYNNFDDVNATYFKPNRIQPSNIITINETNYETYAKTIQNDGGLDLMLIGMGEDGHFCANMPESVQYDKDVYKVDLTTLDAPWNKDFQQALSDKHIDGMYTLGLPSLMKVRHVVLIVNGTHKAKAVERAFGQPMDSNFPSSYLRLLPNLTVILDEEAGQFLPR